MCSLRNRRQEARAPAEGPSEDPGTDLTGATVEFQSQTLKVERFCVRRKAEETDVEDAESDPPHARMRTADPAWWDTQAQRDLGDVMDVDGEEGGPFSEYGRSGRVERGAIRQPLLRRTPPPYLRSFPLHMDPRLGIRNGSPPLTISVTRPRLQSQIGSSMIS